MGHDHLATGWVGRAAHPSILRREYYDRRSSSTYTIAYTIVDTSDDIDAIDALKVDAVDPDTTGAVLNAPEKGADGP